MSSINIDLRDEYQPMSEGYEATEKSLRTATIVLFFVMVIILSIILSYTVLKSFRQKEARLEFFKFSELNSKYEAERAMLNQDR